MKRLEEQLRKGLIVSCQALEDEPLYGSNIMKQMAIAAEQGGAVGIRANSPEDIRTIKESVSVPVIGLYKRFYSDSDIYITPTVEDVKKIVEAGSDIIAFDATHRERPDGVDLDDFVQRVKHYYPDIKLLGDVSTLEEGLYAERLGLDFISTTLSGYTKETEHINEFDFQLLKQLVEKCETPIVAEGRVDTPEIAKRCLDEGAFAVVVGTMITRPQEITKRFVQAIKS